MHVDLSQRPGALAAAACRDFEAVLDYRRSTACILVNHGTIEHAREDSAAS
jgi:hypothetical protein